MEKFHVKTLRSFITFIVSFIVAMSLICTGTLFYIRTANLLTSYYKENITTQLLQVNNKVEDRIKLIDSLYPLIMSNSLIRDSLESIVADEKKSNYSIKLSIEKQLSYLLISNHLWNENFLNAVYIIDINENFYSMSLHKQKNIGKDKLELLLDFGKESYSTLKIKTLKEDKQSIYFIRNIFSTYTGEKIASIIVDINQTSWMNSYMESIDKQWSVFLLNQNNQILSGNTEGELAEYFSSKISNISQNQFFEEVKINQTEYFMASREMDNKGMTSIVIVPKDYLFMELHKTQNSFLILFCIMILITILFSIGVSRFITRPIEKMITYVKKISKGEYHVTMPEGLYSEFNEFAEAFNYMLKQLDIYYTEIYEKQILLKNAQIQSLESQMDPHFLFNVLDTIAWKAAMTDNEEVYQMIVSLGELLRANILSMEREFVTLEEELSYVKFYIFLQQIRFEDKFSIDLLIDPNTYQYLIPRFCIQTLVENAIVHGLEPKKDNGRLCVNVIHNVNTLEIIVLDNGPGFKEKLDIEQIKSSSEDSHTHIGLKNLNKRLFLLFGNECGLKIESIPNEYTAVSFQIPKKEVI